MNTILNKKELFQKYRSCLVDVLYQSFAPIRIHCAVNLITVGAV